MVLRCISLSELFDLMYLDDWCWLGEGLDFGFLCLFIFERERERARESMSTGGGERGGQRIQSGPHCGSREPDAGLKLTVCETVT